MNRKTKPKRKLASKLRPAERLECRRLLAADVILSELVANNGELVLDDNGNAPDWFEIHNRGDSTANLSGYFLTNDLADLDRWQVPEQTWIAPGQSKVLFASNEDRQGANGELHTNFDLDALGGSLALVEPNGERIISQLRDYPALAVDEAFARSYASDDVSFVDSTSSVQWLVPNDNRSHANWMDTSFDATAWKNGIGGVGYQVLPSSTFDVDLVYSNEPIERFSQAQVALADLDGSRSRLRFHPPVINHTTIGNDSFGNYSSDSSIPKPFSADQSDYAIRVTAAFEISRAAAGQWTFGLRNDDGSRLYIDGHEVIANDSLGLAEDSLGTINLRPGFHELELWYWHHHNDDADTLGLVELFVAPGQLTKLDSSFHLVGESSGWWPLVDIDDFIASDVESELRSLASSAYLRYPFTIDDPSAVTSLLLELTFQGGYSAYLNGQPIASDNLPQSATTYDSVATDDSLERHQIPLHDLADFLRPGENVLAVHGLSTSKFATRFLVRPTLNGRQLIETTHVVDPTPGWTIEQHPPVISEFQASNRESIFDEDGQSNDWIEIHNPGKVDIHLTGWHLTDDRRDLTKWSFAETILHPGEYLVIFASSKDRIDGELHTNFRLASAGEYLALVRPDGKSVVSEFGRDGLDYPPQFTDTSYGLAVDEGNRPDFETVPLYFEMPTPGQPNGLGIEQVLLPPRLTQPAGFQSEPFELSLINRSGFGEIYFTRDGSLPLPGNPAAKRYLEAIHVDRTSTIRSAVISGDRFSDTVTASYVFLSDVVTQSPNGETPVNFPDHWGDNAVDYGMDPAIVNDPIWSVQLQAALTQIPSISVVVDIDDMFGADSGIYANPFGDGREWERPASIEVFDKHGHFFQIDAGIRIRGGFSRDPSNAKHSFRFFFRREYGDGKLRYPMFGDEGAREFDKLDLRTAQNYSWSQNGDERAVFIRDVFSRDMQAQMGHLYSRSRPYHVYINGQYWGLYETDERKEAEFAATYLGGSPDDYDVITQKGIIDGNSDAWNRLDSEFQLGLGDDRSSHYYRVQGLTPDGRRNLGYERLLDIDNLMDYAILQYYTGDWDSGKNNNNSYAIYNRVSPDGFKFVDHDSEHSLDVGLESIVDPLPLDASPFNSFWMHEHLLANNSDYRQRFIDRVAELFSPTGVLSPDNVEQTLRSRADMIDLAVIGESARWGDRKRDQPFSKTDWENALASVYEWIDGRTQQIVEQLVGVGFHSGIPAPIPDLSAAQVADGTTVGLSLPGTPVFRSSPLIQSSEGYQFLVPNEEFDREIGNLWTAPGFDQFDDWETGIDDLGFNVLPFIHSRFTTKLPVGSPSAYVVASFDVPDTNADGSIADEWDSLLLQVRIDDGFVAYLNSERVASVHAPDNLGYATPATGTSSSGELQEFAVTSSSLQPTGNVLAIHVLNDSITGSDMSLEFILTGTKQTGEKTLDADIYYTVNGADPRDRGGAVRPEATLFDASNPASFPTVQGATALQSRAFLNGNWSPITKVSYRSGDVGLVITEINYNPYPPSASEFAVLPDLDNNEFEFLEIRNISDQPIELGQFHFSKGIDFAFPDRTLEPFDHALVVRNETAFGLRYGFDLPILGEFGGGLSDSGEEIELSNSVDTPIWRFEYDDEDLWPKRADGIGATLELRPALDSPVDRLDKHYAWQASHTFGGSPGTVGGPYPGILINEVRTNSPSSNYLPDVIELWNPTLRSVDMSGWFLSDSADDFFKFPIPAGTVIGPGELVRFDEFDFNPTVLADEQTGFALNANGDEVWLTIPTLGNHGLGVQTFVDNVHFGAARTGETLGRVPHNRMTPRARSSLGCENSGSRPASVVISEVNYNPGEPTRADLEVSPSLSEDDLEFVEISNLTMHPLDLAGYHIRDGVSFDFPASFRLEAEAAVLVVSFDPTLPENSQRLQAFRNHYQLGDTVNIIGGYSGQLSDSGESIRLLESADPQAKTGPVEIDAIVYDDRDPWPPLADGRGQSLVRRFPWDGWTSLAWTAGLSPGQHALAQPALASDLNRDGFLDAADLDRLLDVIRSESQIAYWDLNTDSVVDTNDLIAYLGETFATKLGDINLDGVIDTLDHAIWYENRFSSCGNWDLGDLNGDGLIDGSDFNIWHENRFRSAVPRIASQRKPQAAGNQFR